MRSCMFMFPASVSRCRLLRAKAVPRHATGVGWWRCPGVAPGARPRRSCRARRSFHGQPQELRYFLTQFVVKHFSRIRSTVQREYPDSLFFLDPALADATIAQNEQSRVLETFVTNPLADEVEVLVQNVSLSELSAQPFKAAVTFQKVYYSPGTRSERNRETYVAQVDFVLRDSVPN